MTNKRRKLVAASFSSYEAARARRQVEAIGAPPGRAPRTLAEILGTAKKGKGLPLDRESPFEGVVPGPEAG